MLEKWSLVKEIERLGISKSFSAAFVGARAFKSSAVSKHQPYQSGPFTIEFIVWLRIATDLVWLYSAMHPLLTPA